MTFVWCRMGSKVAHYAALVVAENPVEVHKEYLEQLEEEEEEDELLQAVRVTFMQIPLPCTGVFGQVLNWPWPDTDAA